MSYKVERRIPDSRPEWRWCVVRESDGEVITHHDQKKDADEYRDVLLEAERLEPQSIAESRYQHLVRGDKSVESEMSQKEWIQLNRVTRSSDNVWTDYHNYD